MTNSPVAVVSPSPAVTNVLPEQPSVKLTPEQAKAREMRGLLDEGKTDRALLLARDLMDSKDVDVRSEVVAVLGWIGRRALPELTELLHDSDEDVARDALTEWERAVDDIKNEQVRAETIVTSVARLENQALIDPILMKFAAMDEQTAIKALKHIIAENRGKIVSNRAKDMYEHISGEFWTE